MPRRRSAIALLVALLAISLTGCDQVRAGARCRVGSPPGRDATHVLVCQGGRWRRAITIGQAAQFVVGNLQGSVTSVNGATASAVAGGSIDPFPRFQVLRRNGQPLGGAKVTLSGSGLAAAVTGVTGSDGVVNFIAGPVATSTVGEWTMTASVDGTDLSTSVSVITTAPIPAAITILSGDAQTTGPGQQAPEPLVLRLTDRYGNPVPNRRVAEAQGFSNRVLTDAPEKTTDANGVAQFILTAAGDEGLLLSSVALASGPFDGPREPSATFSVRVVAGPVAQVEVAGNNLQSAPTGTEFPLLLNARVTDANGYPKRDIAVSFATVPNAGADAQLWWPTVLTDGDGRARVKATAGATPGTYQVIASVGPYSAVFTLTNT